MLAILKSTSIIISVALLSIFMWCSASVIPSVASLYQMEKVNERLFKITYSFFLPIMDNWELVPDKKVSVFRLHMDIVNFNGREIRAFKMSSQLSKFGNLL
jgi:hypothetical protein